MLVIALSLAGCDSRFPGIPKTAVKYYDEGKEAFEEYRRLSWKQGDYTTPEEREKKVNAALEASLSRYFKAVEITESFGEAYAAISRSYLQTFFIQRARKRDVTQIQKSVNEFAEKALALNPEIGEAHFVLGALALDRGDTTEAISKMEACVRYDDAYVDAFSTLGQLYNDLAQTAKAVEYIKRSLALEPENRDNTYNLGMLYVAVEKYGDAADLFKKAVDLDPTDERSKINYAVSVFKGGDEENGMKTIDGIIAQKPKDYLTHSAVAIAFLELDADVDIAIRYGTKAFELKPNYPVAAYIVGDAYFKKADYKKAYEWYTNAYKLMRIPDIKIKMDLAKARISQPGS